MQSDAPKVTALSMFPMVGLVASLATLIVFLLNGWAFSHSAPQAFWGVIFVSSLLGACVVWMGAWEGVQSRVPGVLVLFLLIRFLLDVSVPPAGDSFKTKALQRFLGYLFVFLPFAVWRCAALSVVRLPRLETWLARAILVFSTIVMIPGALGAHLLDQALAYPLLGLLGLIAAIFLRRADPLSKVDRYLFYFAPVLAFLMANAHGASRAVFLSGLSGLLYLLWSERHALVSRLWKVAILVSYALGMLNQSLLQLYSPFTRFLHSIRLSLLLEMIFGSQGFDKALEMNPLDSTPGSAAANINLIWRLAVWKDAVAAWKANPFLGIGFKSIFNSHTVQTSPKLGVGFEDVDIHNSWLQVLLRGGLFLAIPFCAYWARYFAIADRGTRSLLLFWFLITITTVSFETPHLALPVYLVLGISPLFSPKNST